jgi:cysteine desulfurase
MGVNAEKRLRAARQTIASTLKVDEKEIFFTSGGTESDNWAVLQASRAAARRGKHVITTRIEHPAVLNPMKQLEKEGFEVTYLSTDSYGIVSLEELKNAIRPDTVLVSVMGVNNEIGTVEPVEEIGRIIKSINPGTLFFVDAVQMYTKVPVYPKRMKIDMLSVSGHKIHAAKGVGFLYIAKGTKIAPLLTGGGQQQDMRSGTDNVPGIAGMAKAAEILFKEGDERTNRLTALRDDFIKKVTEIDGISVNGPAGCEEMRYAAAPHIVSISVKGIRAEVLLNALSEKGIYVSSGSACSSNKPAISETLKTIGTDKSLLDSTLRFSFGMYNTPEEIDYVLDVLKEETALLRKFTRR